MLLPFAIIAQIETTYLEEWYASDGSQVEATDRVVSLPDIDGNLYVTGTTLNQYGKQDLLLTKYNSTGDEIWSETFNITDTNSNVVVGDIIMNGDDDLYITGTVYNGATQDYDALTVKYDSSGVFKWHKLYDGAGSIYDGGADVMYDQYNRIFVTGSTTSSSGDQDMLTICYSTSGTQLWAKTYDGYGLTDVGARINSYTFAGQAHIRGFSQKTSSSWVVTYITYNSSTGNVVGTPTQSADIYIDEILDVTMDDSQNMYFAGVSDDQGNGNDFMIVKISSGMGIAWTKYYDGADHLDDVAQGIIVDSNTGKVYVTGFSKTSTGGKDLVVLKYSSTGTLEWSETYDGAAGEDDEGLDIKVDNSGQVVVAGYSTEEDTKDYYTLILDSSGNEVWSASFNGVENRDDQVQNLLLDGSGNITVVGHTGTKDNKTTYTTVRYNKKDLFIPPDSEAVSSGIGYCENKGQLIKTDSTLAPEIEFYCTGQSPALYFQDDQVSFVLAHVDTSASTQDTMYRVDMTFNKSKGDERIYGLSERTDYHNYYLGHIPTGREKVRLYDRLVQTDAFEGIDFQYYSNGGGVKYYFVCQPGADPTDIEMVFDGQQSLSVNGNGDLVIGTSLEDIILPQPSVSQFTANGTETTLGWTPTYNVVNDTVKLTVGSFDSNKYLVFRVKEGVPTSAAGLNWVTYFGGVGGFTQDDITALSLSEKDDIYVTGFTENLNFPEIEGEDIFTFGELNFENAFIAKFNEEAVLQYLTLFGGTNLDFGNDIVMSGDNVYAVGSTRSSNFPVTLGSGDATFTDGFVAKFEESNGTLVSSRLIGGGKDDSMVSLDVYDNNIYLVGRSFGVNTDFPLENSGSSYYQSSNFGLNDGVILQLDESLAIEWSTYFGGFNDDLPNEIMIDKSSGSFYIVGRTNTTYYSSQNCTAPTSGGFPNCQPTSSTQLAFANGVSNPQAGLFDLFIAEFNSDNQLVWSTFLGGGDQDLVSGFSQGNIAINPLNSGEISILGTTQDFSTFPSNPSSGYFQNLSVGYFAATFQSRQLSWVSGFGCVSDVDEINSARESLTYDTNGNLLILGSTNCNPPISDNFCEIPTSNVFPICPPLPSSGNFFQEDGSGNPVFQGVRDIFIAGFSPNRTLKYATYFGGNNNDVVSDARYSTNSDQIFFVGYTSSSSNFPLTFPSTPPDLYRQEVLAGSQDGFIARLLLTDITTSLSESPLKGSVLKLYPNPAVDYLYLELGEEPENQLIKLCDFTGKLIEEYRIPKWQKSAEINVKNLPNGVYNLIYKNKGYLFVKQQ